MIVNVTRKIDSVQVTSVLGGAGLTIYEGRVCDSGHAEKCPLYELTNPH